MFLNASLKNIKFTTIYKGIIHNEWIIPFIKSQMNERPLKVSTKKKNIKAAKIHPLTSQIL